MWKLVLNFILVFIIFNYHSLNYGQQFPNKKYVPADGKIIGIWPHNDRFKSVEKLNELKERWGFNYILLAAIYGRNELSSLKQAGFDSLHVMYQIYLPDYINKKENFWSNINQLGKLWAYYFDEPISREQPFIQFLKLISELCNNDFYPQTKFIVSEVDEQKAIKFQLVADEITYSGYGDIKYLGLDQVRTWSEWQKYLGNKFSLLWIGAHEDMNEYQTLFEAANKLGINSIWLYALEPLQEGMEADNNNYEKFCDAAVEFGFMKVK